MDLRQTATRLGLQDPFLAGIVLLSLALKLVLALSMGHVEPVNDENAYVSLAHQIADQGQYSSLLRPPLYPAIMAALFNLGGNLAAVRLFQVFLSTITVLFVYHLGRSYYGPLVARLAAGLFAFDPVLVAFSHLLWSETLFIFLHLAALLLLVRPGFHRRRWFAAGLLLGLAALTRPLLLTFLPFLLVWAYLQKRRQPAPATGEDASPATATCFGLMVLGMFLVVFPWTVRNYRATGAFVLVDTNGTYNLLVSTEPTAAFVDKDDHWDRRWARLDGVPYSQVSRRQPGTAQRRALEISTQRMLESPGRFVWKSVWEAGHLWTLDSFLLRHLRNGWYGGGISRWQLRGLVVVTGVFTLVLLATGVVGLAVQPVSSLRTLMGMALIHATLVFGLTYSLSRYAVPLRPLLALSAAWLLCHRSALATSWRSGPAGKDRVITALLILAALLSIWWRDLPVLADMFITGGSAFVFTVSQ